MPQCLKCGAELQVNEEGIAPVLCDNCAGQARRRARISFNTGTMRDYPATTTLVAINLAVFVWMVFTGAGFLEFSQRSLIHGGANVGPYTLGGQYWRLVTAGFQHAGLLHIGFNMWCLWYLGPLSEKLFGKWQTFMIYLLTGVGGALLSVAHNPGVLEIGASGAIFGIAGAILAGVKFGNIAISAGEKKAIFSSMTSFVAFNLLLGFGLFSFGVGIDNWCHLGGLITGLLIGLPLGAFIHANKLVHAGVILVTGLLLGVAGQQLVAAHPEFSLPNRVNAALARHDYPKAIALLEQYTQVEPDNDQAFNILGSLYAETGQADKAINAFQQALRINPDSPEAKQALQQLQDAGGTRK